MVKAYTQKLCQCLEAKEINGLEKGQRADCKP